MPQNELFEREPITMQQMVDCAKRELHLRERVYPHRIQEKKMSEDKAAHEIHAMQAILDLLRALIDANMLIERRKS